LTTNLLVRPEAESIPSPVDLYSSYCRLFGSAFPRAVPMGLLSSGLTAILYYYPGHDYFARIWGHPYVYNNLGFIIGFILIFRSNFAYGRFVTGRNMLQTMSARWSHACSSSLAFEAADTAHRLGRHAGDYEAMDDSGFGPPLAFDPKAIDPQAYTAAIRRFEAFKTAVLHKFSLLHALALQHLRVDWKLSNLAPHLPTTEPPPEDAAALLDRKFDLKQYFALPASADQALDFAEISPLVVIPGMSREDTGANMNIRGGCVTTEELVSLGYQFEAFAEKQFETTFGGMDIRKTNSLERNSRLSNDIDVSSINEADFLEDASIDQTTLSGGSPRSPNVSLDMNAEEPKSPRISKQPSLISKVFQQQTGMFVIGAQERVYTAYAWVQSMLAQRSDCKYGWKAISAPTGVSAWRALDEGFEAFEQCRALVDTPFPFPWAQAMVVFLIIYTITSPLLMIAWLNAVWIACTLNFLSVLTFWTLNEVARDLESPFIFPPNDLPLARMQYNFNERLLAAASAVFEEAVLRYSYDYATRPVVTRGNKL